MGEQYAGWELGNKIRLCLQGWGGGFGTGRYRSLGSKFSEYGVKKRFLGLLKWEMHGG